MSVNINALKIPMDSVEELKLLHPLTKQPILCKETGLYASVLVSSGDSAAARAARRETQALVMKRKGSATVEDAEAATVNLLVAITSGWYLVTPEGEEIDFEYNEANARTLYSTPELFWIKEQVDEFAGERANFIKKTLTKESSDGQGKPSR